MTSLSMVCYRTPIKVGWKSVMAGKRLILAAVIALGMAAAPAVAQFTGPDSEKFVAAVRERDGSKAIELLQGRPTVVNARDGKGDTGLIVAIGGRDPDWTGYLLNHGADPNLPARNGDTPLIAAARVGFDDAVQWLINRKVKVDADNRMGETALIVAVQQRHIPVIKRLLAAGANPDKADSAAGYSARDYAKRDTRMPELLRLIEAAKTPAAPAKLKF
ncbi:MAG: ankyrin repeat domain-containing protein [Sphingomicrobium sp.]